MIIAPAISGATVSRPEPCPDFQRGTRLGAIQASGVLRVGVGNDLPGYGWIDDDGVRSGLDVRVSQALSQGIFGGDIAQASEHIQFVDCIPKDREQMLADNEVDVVVNAFAITEERRRVVDFAGVYYGSHVGFACRTGETKSIASSAIGAIEGTVDEQFLRDHKVGARVVTYEDTWQAAEALSEGRVDYWADARSCISAYLSFDESRQLRLTDDVGSFRPWAAAVAKGDAELGRYVDTRMADVVESGSLILLAGSDERA